MLAAGSRFIESMGRDELFQALEAVVTAAEAAAGRELTEARR